MSSGSKGSYLPAPGDVVAGRYKVMRAIGAGGMGAVFECEHLVMGNKVALKFCTQGSDDDSEERKRFYNEARAAAAVEGEHVARVYDVARLDSGIPYIVMEYLEGQDLARVLKAKGPFAVHEACGVVIEVLEGLAIAHRAGIVHRDLKPSNVFLAKCGDETVVKVLDFGISKVVSGAPVTHTGTLMGTPGYMSPEQVRSARNVDARSDIFSVGVMLYKLLAGVGPYEGESFGEILAAILESRHTPLLDAAPHVPPRLAACVERCLEKLPEDRYASARELAADLRAFVSPHATFPSAEPSARNVPVDMQTLTEAFSATRGEPKPRRRVAWIAWPVALLVLVPVVFFVGQRVLRSPPVVPSAAPSALAVESPLPTSPLAVAPVEATPQLALSGQLGIDASTGPATVAVGRADPARGRPNTRGALPPSAKSASAPAASAPPATPSPFAGGQFD